MNQAAEAMDFKSSNGISIGIELELQILNARDYNLARDATDLLAVLGKSAHASAVKPEITESMIELNSSVHANPADMLAELKQIRESLGQAAGQLNVRIAGGGSHPFHKWGERRIYPTERFRMLLDVYGYLAKQFTVFGQHIHVGCPDGDTAIRLVHMFSRYVPHFIALSASSPFQEGADTGFQSSRLNTVSAFPLSGTMPFVTTWNGFTEYFEKMRAFGIVESMKDFYWDIRPKPEYGTVEIRVLDTPLTLERAVLLAALAQMLAHYALNTPPQQPTADLYLVYRYNRFQACRYGYDAAFIDARTGARLRLLDDLLVTLRMLEAPAAALGSAVALAQLHEIIDRRDSDAMRIRAARERLGSLNDVMRQQSETWMGRVS